MVKSENPWGLTEAQASAMDEMCKHGCIKAAARALNISPKTMEAHCYQAGKRMNMRGRVLTKYIIWDRWRRGSEQRAA